MKRLTTCPEITPDTDMTKDEQLMLAMWAGARAILNTKRYESATFVHDIFEEYGKSKKISYYEAAQILCESADAIESALSALQAENKGE